MSGAEIVGAFPRNDTGLDLKDFADIIAVTRFALSG